MIEHILSGIAIRRTLESVVSRGFTNHAERSGRKVICGANMWAKKSWTFKATAFIMIHVGDNSLLCKPALQTRFANRANWPMVRKIDRAKDRHVDFDRRQFLGKYTG
jgi:hypothetical protein